VYQTHTVSCIFTPRLKKQFQTPWENDPCFGEREVKETPPLAFPNETKGHPMSRAQLCTVAHLMHGHTEHTVPHAELGASVPTLRKPSSNVSVNPEEC